MYTVLSTLLALAFLYGAIVFISRIKITTLMGWLQILFCISFFSCLVLLIYYAGFYLGESRLLQDIYIVLFKISIILFLLIIGLKFFKFLKS